MKNTNNKVNLQTLENMIELYKLNHGQDADYLASELFDMQSFNELLSHPKCKGIRIFNVIKENETGQQNRLVLVAVDENGKIILHQNQIASVSAAAFGLGMFTTTVVAVAEHGQPCPPDCLNAHKLI